MRGVKAPPIWGGGGGGEKVGGERSGRLKQTEKWFETGEIIIIHFWDG